MYTKVPENLTIFAILFAFVTKLQKLVAYCLHWFDDINKKKKQLTSEAISHR